MGKRKIKKLFMLMTAAAMAVAGTVLTTFPVSADSRIRSKGNLIFEEGGSSLSLINLCMADMDALQSEIDALDRETPDISGVAFYGAARKDKLKSHGILDYADGTLVIDSSDLFYLADEIDLLEAGYKTNTVTALGHIGTHFLDDGSITYERDVEATSPEVAVKLSFAEIYEGILKSQSVAHLADRQAVNGSGAPLYYADIDAMSNNSLISATTESNDFPIFIRPADVGNLTAGAAAWVNGELIIGNGADNDAYYNQGYIDGYNQSMEGVSIAYQYHEHTGNEYECGGCYQAGRHVHTGCPSHTEGTGEYSQCGFNSGHDDGGGAACPTHGSEWTYGVSDGNGTFTCCGYKEEIVRHVYDCGYPHNRWSMDCGMTENTIISATIVFQ